MVTDFNFFDSLKSPAQKECSVQGSFSFQKLRVQNRFAWLEMRWCPSRASTMPWQAR